MNDYVGRERDKKVNQTGFSHSHSFSPGFFIPSHKSHCCEWPGPPTRTPLVMWKMRKARYRVLVQSLRSSGLVMMNWLLDWAFINVRGQIFLGARPLAPAANSTFLSVYPYDGSPSCPWPEWRPFFSPSFVSPGAFTHVDISIHASLWPVFAFLWQITKISWSG